VNELARAMAGHTKFLVADTLCHSGSKEFERNVRLVTAYQEVALQLSCILLQ
jgi:hypothetical protein